MKNGVERILGILVFDALDSGNFSSTTIEKSSFLDTSSLEVSSMVFAILRNTDEVLRNTDEVLRNTDEALRNTKKQHCTSLSSVFLERALNHGIKRNIPIYQNNFRLIFRDNI